MQAQGSSRVASLCFCIFRAAFFATCILSLQYKYTLAKFASGSFEVKLMRYSFSLLALLSASAAWADTIPVSSKVTEVTMYPETAAITRTATFAIPAGKHRLVLQGVPDTALLEFLRIDLTGVHQISTAFRSEYAPPHETGDPRVAEAEALIDEIEQRIQSVKDDALSLIHI